LLLPITSLFPVHHPDLRWDDGHWLIADTSIFPILASGNNPGSTSLSFCSLSIIQRS